MPAHSLESDQHETRVLKNRRTMISAPRRRFCYRSIDNLREGEMRRLPLSFVLVPAVLWARQTSSCCASPTTEFAALDHLRWECGVVAGGCGKTHAPGEGGAGKEAHIGTVGWRFGGGWSLQAALLAGKQAALNAPVLGVFGTRDAWITPKVVDEFAAAMKSAGKLLTVKM